MIKLQFLLEASEPIIPNHFARVFLKIQFKFYQCFMYFTSFIFHFFFQDSAQYGWRMLALLWLAESCVMNNNTRSSRYWIYRSWKVRMVLLSVSRCDKKWFFSRKNRKRVTFTPHFIPLHYDRDGLYSGSGEVQKHSSKSHRRLWICSIFQFFPLD